MGDNVIDDGDMVIKLGGKMGGGDTGQLIVTDVTFTVERDNEAKHGIGNKDPRGMKYGNRTYSLSKESQENEAVADLVVDMYLNSESPKEAVIRSNGATEVSVGKVDWNNVEKSASDDGDVTLTIDADCREVDISRDA